MGQYYLGRAYFQGVGVDRIDQRKGVQYLKQSADQGNPLALFSLGRMHQDGAGGCPKDENLGLSLLLQACSRGDSFTLCYVAGMFFEGRLGASKNVHEGIRLLKLAADAGYGDALLQLANLYLSGEGVAQDYTRAMQYYRLGKGEDEDGLVARKEAEYARLVAESFNGPSVSETAA